MADSNTANRTEDFQKNDSLESFLIQINNDLWPAEANIVNHQTINYPPLFIVGPLRSGTTLMLQWLANLGLAYPSNLMSRFYRAPILASKIQLLLTDPRYNYRNEILDFNSYIEFASDNGKTQGALAPNEFWYFWRRFLPFKDVDYLPTESLLNQVDTQLLKSELAGMMNVFQKPIALKAMILNYNIDFLDHIFPNTVFIHIKRDPLANIESALQARKRQLGSINEWYSFKIPEYDDLINRDPYEQVAGQIYYTNKAIEKSLSKIPQHKQLTVNYEQFCQSPETVFYQLQDKLADNGCQWRKQYDLQDQFELTRPQVKDEAIWRAYKTFFVD